MIYDMAHELSQPHSQQILASVIDGTFMHNNTKSEPHGSISSAMLVRTKQCNNCPWKQSTDPRLIPDGYSIERHNRLRKTIAGDTGEQLRTMLDGEPVRVMSCHKHATYERAFCVGWLYNQITIGNNIAMRLYVSNCSNKGELEVFGEQHADFEDTIPPEDTRHEQE